MGMKMDSISDSQSGEPLPPPDAQGQVTAVSVIIPVFNSAPYFEKCLRSIVEQTLPNIEIICINDGSTDETLPILQNFAMQDARITVISRKNMGQSVSRNQALAIATGKYISFVDADDYLDRKALELLYAKAEKYQAEMINFAGINFADNTGETVYTRSYTISYVHNSVELLSREDLEAVLLSVPTSCCRMFYLRKFIVDNHIFFPEFLVYEDNYFIMKGLLHARTFAVEHSPLYYRRLHEGQVTKKTDLRFTDYIVVHKKIAQLLVQKKIADNFLEPFLKKTSRNIQKHFAQLSEADQKQYLAAVHDFESFAQALLRIATRTEHDQPHDKLFSYMQSCRKAFACLQHENSDAQKKFIENSQKIVTLHAKRLEPSVRQSSEEQIDAFNKFAWEKLAELESLHTIKS